MMSISKRQSPGIYVGVAISTFLATIICVPSSVVATPQKAEKQKSAPTQKSSSNKDKKNTAAQPPSAPAKTPEPEKTKAPSIALGNSDIDFSKAPTNISADSLTLLNEKRTFTYQGKVVVTQADLTLHADFLDGAYSEKNEIQTIVARSNVDITKGTGIKATGQRAVYNALDRTIVLTESPAIEQNGSTLTADLIRIFIDENRSVAEGNVKVTMKNIDEGLQTPPPAPAVTP